MELLNDSIKRLKPTYLSTAFKTQKNGYMHFLSLNSFTATIDTLTDRNPLSNSSWETNPITIPIAHEYTKYSIIEERMEQLKKDRQEALAAHKLAHHQMENQIKSKFKPFKLGQKVWLDLQHIQT